MTAGEVSRSGALFWVFGLGDGGVFGSVLRMMSLLCRKNFVLVYRLLTYFMKNFRKKCLLIGEKVVLLQPQTKGEEERR